MACARVSVIAALAVLPFSPLSAEITLDGTMGAAGPLPGPNFTIADTVGTIQGANLFHSFSVFNIDSTESATFTGPAGLDNVISRVTGGTASSIDGLFQSTVPGADVYFINPAGVVFGQNATLDVPGAFHASTADGLRFADDNVFSASNPPATVLTAAAPAAFGFFGANPAGITVNDSALGVSAGETVSLVGGDITIAGTDRNRPLPNLEAASGRLNLVSVDASGEVTLTGSVLDARGFAAFGDITVQESRLDVSGSPGGAVYIKGGNIVIDSAQIWSDSSGAADGGDITLKGDSVLIQFDEVRVGNSNPVSAGHPHIRTTTSGTGRGGDLRIEADILTVNKGVRVWSGTTGPGRGGDILMDVGRLVMRDTAYISAWTVGSGRGGDVIVDADSISIIHDVASRRDTAINSELYGTGDAGDIRVSARTIELRDDPALAASSGPASIGGYYDGQGQGGDTYVTAGTIVMTHDSEIYNQSAGPGSGGNLHLDVGHLEVRSSSAVATGATGDGDAGDLYVIADSILISDDDVLKERTAINADAAFGLGNGGDVNIEAGTLEIRGGRIAADAFSPGIIGGNVTIVVDDLLLDGKGNIFPRTLETPTLANCTCIAVDTTRITASAPFNFSGAAGNIDITADTITVRGGAAIEAVSGGTGPGGTVTILANSILVESEARIDAGSIGSGPGGNVVLSARDLTLESGGHITASSTGSGLAGDILISLTDRFQSDGGFVTTEALASDGGNITLNAITMVDLLNSSITTSVQGGAGAGGNINIDPQFVIVQNSNIIANAFGGPGGNINITASLFLIDPSSVISASSALGLNGIINVDSPVADVTSGVTELPADELDASTLVQAPCAARIAGGTSSLTSVGRSGLPADPDGYLPSPGLVLNTGAVSTADATSTPVPLHADMHGDSALLLTMSGLGCS